LVLLFTYLNDARSYQHKKKLKLVFGLIISI